MSKANIGGTIEMVPQRVFITLIYDEEENLSFEIVDTLDYESDNSQLIACAARGMVEAIVKDLEGIVQLGTEAFVRDGVLVPIVNLGTTTDTIGETVGSA